MTAPTMPSPSEHPQHALIERDTRAWLERAVIGLNLCPFAKAVHVKGQIHFVVSTADDGRELLDDLARELQALDAIDPAVRSTTLLIPPDFSRALAGPQAGATLTLVQDPTLTIGPRIVQDLLASVSDGISGSRISLAVVQEQANARAVAHDPAARAALAQP